MKKFLRMSALILALTCAGFAESADRELIREQLPEYPALLKKIGIGGTVKLSALVAADGTVKSAKIDGGNPMLGEIACGAVKKWKYAVALAPSNVLVEMVFDAKSATVRVKQ
jgi:TonB family protein